MRHGTVRSVNAGRLAPVPGRTQPSAIDKGPVGRVEVRDPGTRKGGSGVVGDEIGSARHHGGTTQAVYAVAREELDHWGHVLGRDLPDGCFGENLTTAGHDVDGALVGERWRVGEALLEVTGPRVPCGNFAAHMGERGWVKRFSERGRTGAYLAVVEPGVVAAGDPVQVVHRPEHDDTVPRVFRAVQGDRAEGEAVLAAGVLHPDDRDWLARRLRRG
jgi:MOSC domain-containing protein YiiM